MQAADHVGRQNRYGVLNDADGKHHERAYAQEHASGAGTRTHGKPRAALLKVRASGGTGRLTATFLRV